MEVACVDSANNLASLIRAFSKKSSSVGPNWAIKPTTVNMRTFQSFSGSASFDQGGDPQNDDERYQLLSAPTDEWDGNTVNGKEDDFRFLVSAGPFEVMEPGASLSFQVGMVVGPGLGTETNGSGLLANCAEAALTWYGIYVNRIPEVTISTTGQILDPGQNGRETMLCEDQFANTSNVGQRLRRQVVHGSRLR